MNFRQHSELEGQHAFLSASKYHWINYDIERLRESYLNYMASIRGTELHALAKDLIKHRIRLPKVKKTFNLYVNDAIGYNMTPEQPLYYSKNCFGTCDAICFRNNLLRIHDLKTGTTPASMHQLEIYAAYFCLDYGKKPIDIDCELRIYQNNEVLVHEPPAEDIMDIMQKIILFDKEIEKMNMEA